MAVAIGVDGARHTLILHLVVKQRRRARDQALTVGSDEFDGPADDLDKIMYGFSLLVCLPDSMSSPPSAATGTVFRPSTLRRYAHDAGYAGVTVLPIEDFSFFRFYELTT